MPLLLFQSLCFKENQRVQIAAQTLYEGGKQLLMTGQQAGFQQRSLYRYIVGGFIQAFLHGANAMADFQPDVPKVANQSLKLFLQRRAGFLRQQNQQVNIGSRVELTPAIAAHGSECQRCREIKQVP